jgi:hypothetical protein
MAAPRLPGRIRSLGRQLGGRISNTFSSVGSGWDLALDAVEAGGEHDGEGQVGVAGRVGRAVLDPGVEFLAGFVVGDADEVAAVAASPGE